MKNTVLFRKVSEIGTNHMIIELIKFKVPVAEQEEYLRKDAAIWTSALAQYPGFLGKEVWLNSEISDELTLVIHWESREQWKAIPADDLSVTEANFVQALGKSYPILELKEYYVRSSSGH